MRQYTKLDELASALGALQMADRLNDLIKEQKETREKMLNALKEFSQAEHLQQQSEAQREAADLAQDEEKKEQLQKKARNNQLKAKRHLKKAQQLNQEARQALANYLTTERGQRDLRQAVEESMQETRDQVKNVNNLQSSLGYGTEAGIRQSMSVKERIRLAEAIREKPKLQQIAKLTGRMKKIAAKKQKSKSSNSVVNNCITEGNNPERLLPSELALLTRQETKLDFLRRFAEKKTLQYAPKNKEKLGKGPIVVCLDTSGSMQTKDPEAKAVMLALLAVAKKQRRAFAVINFASASQVKVWEFPKAVVPPEKVVELAEFFWNGGTDFQVPLDNAIKVFQSSRFNKADVVFITDGDSSVRETWLNGFLKVKKQKGFSVIAVQLGQVDTMTLEQFSDRVINAKSLFDEEVTDAILGI